ncbi:MAG: L,D-transpeptidase family protein [Pseudomonadota bacterium]|nr:L,D-transpeptidase family protein [Pseudomonadota bacterium]
MDLIVKPSGWLHQGEARYRCALGRAGITTEKHEGDGATPAGHFPLRHLYYRADRIAALETGLPKSVITENHGWCDDPACASYNNLVRLPHAGSHEVLWRKDALYDAAVTIGHNYNPAVAGMGSAIFLHVAAPGFTPTEGCIALDAADLIAVLVRCDVGTSILITP